MKISQSGLDLIKSFEGLSLVAYKDIIGVITIGYGHTSPSLTMNQKVTLKEAEDLLKADVVRFENGVNSLVKVPITQNQFDALVSFSYNLGTNNLGKSTLLKKLNSGAPVGEIVAEFVKWNRAGGKVVKGLTDRRQKESTLFLK